MMSDSVRAEMAREKLAKRLAAHPRIEWRPGMLALDLDASWPGPVRVCDEDENPFEFNPGAGFHEEWTSTEGRGQVLKGYVTARLFPDLTDPATCGVLWAMLVEACKDARVKAVRSTDGEVTLYWLAPPPNPLPHRSKLFTDDSEGVNVAEALLEVLGGPPTCEHGRAGMCPHCMGMG